MEAIVPKATLLLTLIFTVYFLKYLHILKTEDTSVVSRMMFHLALPSALISGIRNFRVKSQFLLLIPLALACYLLLVATRLLMPRKRPQKFNGYIHYKYPAITSEPLFFPPFKVSYLSKKLLALCSKLTPKNKELLLNRLAKADRLDKPKRVTQSICLL